MINAEIAQDQEQYNKVRDYRDSVYTSLLQIQCDLMEYGHFTRQDVMKMKVIERRFHIRRIEEKLKEHNK